MKTIDYFANGLKEALRVLIGPHLKLSQRFPSFGALVRRVVTFGGSVDNCLLGLALRDIVLQ